MDGHTSSVSGSEVAETRLENKVSSQGKWGGATPSSASHVSGLLQSPRLSASSLVPPRDNGLFVVPSSSDPSPSPQQAGLREGNALAKTGGHWLLRSAGRQRTNCPPLPPRSL